MSTAHEPTAPEPTQPRRRFWRIPLVVGVVFILVLLLRAGPAPSSAEHVSVPAGWPNPRPAFKQSLQGAVPRWMWRLRDRFRAPPRQLVIVSALLSFTNAVPAASLPHAAPALSDTNGFRVWIVSSNEWRGLHENLTKRGVATASLGACVMTAHGVPATVSRGSSNGMFTLQHAPLIRGDIIDLTTVFSYFETMPSRTNGPFAARLQIPVGHRALFLHEPLPGDARQTLALLVTPNLRPRK